MINSNKKNNNITLNGLLISLILSFLSMTLIGINFNPDSFSYINGDYVRPPAYPVVINFLGIIFKQNHLYVLVFLQVFFWLIASIYFSSFLCKLFKINKYYRFFFLFLLILPLNPVQKYGNTILTESFSFICCIIVFASTCNFFTYEKKKYLIYLFLSLVFALTLRHQMIFLNFSLLVLAVLLFIEKKRRVATALFLISVLSVLLSSLINKSYALKKFDKFDENKRIGLQLIVLPLFNLSDNTLKKINHRDRKIIEEMKMQFQKVNPFFSYKKNESLSIKKINQYASSYNSIISNSVLPVLEKNYSNLSIKEKDKKLFELALVILKASIKYEPIKIIKIYINNVIVLGFSGVLWFFICLTVILLSLINFSKLKSPAMFTLLLVSISQFVNISLVSILEPVLFRYSFYTNLSLCALISAVCISGFEKLIEKKN